jgi:hypothetical protein
MEETGRRAKHITAWRGPCTITERLSATAYAVTHDDTKRTYERVISNMLPYRAKRAKTNANARYNEVYSEPLSEGELIAIRDDPTGPIYIAEVSWLQPTQVTLHYFGTTGLILATAVFKPCWHEIGHDEIRLDFDPLEDADFMNFIPYAGNVDLDDIHTVLVARNIEFTQAGRLRSRSLRSLTPFHDQIFRFER